jgi:hypothetical protein
MSKSKRPIKGMTAKKQLVQSARIAAILGLEQVRTHNDPGNKPNRVHVKIEVELDRSTATYFIGLGRDQDDASLWRVMVELIK